MLWHWTLNGDDLAERARWSERLKLIRHAIPGDGDGNIVLRIRDFVKLPPRRFYFTCGRRNDRLMRYGINRWEAIGEYRMGEQPKWIT